MDSITVVGSDKERIVTMRICPPTVQELDQLVRELTDLGINNHCEVRILKYTNDEAVLRFVCPTKEYADKLLKTDWNAYCGEV